MIALTQEKREELIERYSQQIITFKYHLSQIGQEHFDGKAYAEILLKTEIALASLTAECKYFQWKWVRDESAVWTTTPIEKLSDAVSAFGEDGENVTYRMLFTAPPVLEISPLENDVKNIIQLLSDSAWAENCTSTELGNELESKITELHNEVPEIKFPHELMDLVNAVEFYHKVKAENPDPETGAWNDAYDWIKKASIEAAPVIKRLNGLGE